MDKEIKDRYESILNRSFNNDLTVFFFEEFLQGRSKEANLLEKYSSFKPDDVLIEKYNRASQLNKNADEVEGQKVVDIDKALNELFERHGSSMNQLKDTYKKRFLKLEDFTSIYQSSKRECHYCQITEEEIHNLIEKGNIRTIRLGTRGRKLEIDRKDAHGGYEKENIVLCCYWCNNAKTDEFFHDEFLKVGEEIKEIWRKRKESL